MLHLTTFHNVSVPTSNFRDIRKKLVMNACMSDNLIIHSESREASRFIMSKLPKHEVEVCKQILHADPNEPPK